jgi:hypothetical protein
MLKLPSIWILIISTLVFFIAAGYLRRYLDEQDIPKGMTRGVLILTLASLASWGVGEAAAWAQEAIEGPPPVVQNAPDQSQIPKEDDQIKP